MATVAFTVQTADGTTINITHTVNLSDADLNRMFAAMLANNPGFTNDQLVRGWVTRNMQNASDITVAHEQTLAVPPAPVSFSLT